MIPGGNTYTSLLLSMMMLYQSAAKCVARALVLLLEEYTNTLLLVCT